MVEITSLDVHFVFQICHLCNAVVEIRMDVGAVLILIVRVHKLNLSLPRLLTFLVISTATMSLMCASIGIHLLSRALLT